MDERGRDTPIAILRGQDEDEQGAREERPAKPSTTILTLAASSNRGSRQTGMTRSTRQDESLRHANRTLYAAIFGNVPRRAGDHKA